MISRRAAETAEKKIYKSSFVFFVAKKNRRIGMIPRRVAETAEENIKLIFVLYVPFVFK